ncbi:MAG: phosphoribosylanthranilate isomerase [Betaproteobacteria bacterium]|nr:phosphoribosylanthranilate isomerase [Betaproteobacteria bacterium]
MPRTRVKFCGLVRPADVDEAVRLGVDAIGFVFYPRSPRALDAEAARSLRRRLPSWVSAVGLFVNEAPERVRATATEVGLDVVQFHGDENPAECALSLPAGLPFWRAVRMRGSVDLLESAGSFGAAEAFLVDAYTEGFGGSGKGFNWSWLPSSRGFRLVLSGGLNPLSVGDAIAQVRPEMVDVSSGIQGADPRTKDPALMGAFMAAVLQADARLSTPDAIGARP